jgi:hypothetical protein
MKLLTHSAAAVLLSLGAAQAGDTMQPLPTSTTDTTAFVGLNWTFGASGSATEGVIGAARITTDSSGNSDGAKLSVHMNLSNGLSFGKVKLTGMTGESDRMAELGAGFGTGGFLGTAGLWMPYVNLGADLSFGGGLDGYVGFHTLGEWDAPPLGLFGEF